jgi:hypothetical protein
MAEETKDRTVTTLQSWIRQGSAHLDVMAPIKARASDAWQAVLGSNRRSVGTGPRIMARGVERC